MEGFINNNTKRGVQLAKNTLVISFGTFLPKLLATITLPIITAGLTKAEFGTYDLICILESLFLPCVTLQIHTAAFRFLIEARNNDKRTKSIITNVVFFVFITSLVALSIFYVCLNDYEFKTKLLVCGFFLFDILKTAVQQIARGLSKNILYSTSAIINSFVNVLVIVLCVYLYPMGLDGVVASLLVASSASVIYLFKKLNIWSQINITLINKNVIKEMLAFSWPMIPNTVSLWIMNLSNRLLLTFFLGIEVNAVFAVAYKIPSLFTVVQSTFTLAWQENASIVSTDKDSGLYYGKMFDTVFNLMVGVMSCLICSTPLLFYVLIKGDYAEAYNQIPILFLAVFFNVIVAFLGGIYVAKKETKSVGITTTIAAMLNILINFALIQLIGIYAASISMVLSYVFLALYRMRDIQKYVKIDFNIKKIFYCVLLLLLMCLLCSQQSLPLDIINIAIALTVSICLNKAFILKLIKINMRS